ncbi:TetR/AcrR family transcriptional regulator [Leifsonia sp. YAF41]|uniref:TetR/AcrR family transcriptional regulator n=1 Tax=Leifsonia sp. YAF41 TaxID=3233086 RepID=UPI003F9B04D9
MDVRAERTVTALYGAILSLAETHDVAELTASQVAQAAGINRVTFYNHASSPAQLLVDALRVELDDIRQRFLISSGESPLQSTARRTTLAVAAHMIERRAVYRRSLPADAHGILADFLSEHFAASVRLLLADRPNVHIGSSRRSPVSAPVFSEATAQFVAHGCIGAFAVWLHTDDPLIPADVVDLIEDLMPAWWSAADDASSR